MRHSWKTKEGNQGRTYQVCAKCWFARNDGRSLPIGRTCPGSMEGLIHRFNRAKKDGKI